jgi:antitoxin (DNA-binding transcriptional repressor) of toxin-antitoxin stability system
MRTVGLKTLKNRLSEYVRSAAAGEIVLVTDRNRVVAEIGPPRTAHPATDEAFLVQGVREGWLTPPASRTGKPPPGLALASLDQILRELDRDREDR